MRRIIVLLVALALVGLSAGLAQADDSITYVGVHNVDLGETVYYSIDGEKAVTGTAPSGHATRVTVRDPAKWREKSYYDHTVTVSTESRTICTVNYTITNEFSTFAQVLTCEVNSNGCSTVAGTTWILGTGYVSITVRKSTDN